MSTSKPLIFQLQVNTIKYITIKIYIRLNMRSISSVFKVKLCILESTKSYENSVTLILQGYGIPVHRIHSNKIYAFVKVKRHFAKTDKFSVGLLESYARFVTNQEECKKLISEQEKSLKDLSSIGHNLEEYFHDNKCKLDHILKGKAKIYLQKQIEFINRQLTEIRKDVQQVVSNTPDLQVKNNLLTGYKEVGKKTDDCFSCS